MTEFTRRGVVAVTVLGLVSTCLPATGIRADSAPGPLADGKADGTLTVNAKTTKVAFAYARSMPGFFDKNVNDVLVIVSDVPLDAKALADQFMRSKMADAGKLQAAVSPTGFPIMGTVSWRSAMAGTMITITGTIITTGTPTAKQSSRWQGDSTTGSKTARSAIP